MEYKIPADLLQKLIDILTMRPYADVYQALDPLRKLIEEQKPLLEEAAKDASGEAAA